MPLEKPKVADLLAQCLEKYKVEDLYEILESLLREGKHITGFSNKMDKEYFLRKFMEIALDPNVTNAFHRTIALEKAARIMGHWDREDKKEPTQIKVVLDQHEPAGY